MSIDTLTDCQASVILVDMPIHNHKVVNLRSLQRNLRSSLPVDGQQTLVLDRGVPSYMISPVDNISVSAFNMAALNVQPSEIQTGLSTIDNLALEENPVGLQAGSTIINNKHNHGKK